MVLEWVDTTEHRAGTSKRRLGSNRPALFQAQRGIGLRLIQFLGVMTVLLFGCVIAATGKVSVDEAANALPRGVSGFRMVGPVRHKALGKDESQTAKAAPVTGFAFAEADYVAADGEKFLVELTRGERDSDAYSLLTLFASSARKQFQNSRSQLNREIGTASFYAYAPGSVAFFKGVNFVVVSNVSNPEKRWLDVVGLARLLAEGFDKGEGDVPILVKHLPEWETAQSDVTYLAGFHSLKDLAPNQPVLEAVTSEGDADAVLTSYGSAQFLLVEFNTPQLAGDNDRAITAKLNELRQQGQPVPTSYRKVGNYSVFVFNAASEAEAQSLIDQVEYAQMVTWLGDNPYLLEQAQRDYYETTAGVLVSVVQASGLSLLGCLGIGGLIGALLFNRRRAQQRAAEAYSDAGGMLRLNLDDITPQSDPAKLLRP